VWIIIHAASASAWKFNYIGHVSVSEVGIKHANHSDRFTLDNNLRWRLAVLLVNKIMIYFGRCWCSSQNSLGPLESRFVIGGHPLAGLCTKSCPIRYQYSRDGTLTDAFVYTASRKKHVAFLCLNTSVIIKYYRRPLQRSVGPGTIDLDNCVRSFCRWRWKLQEPINQSINQPSLRISQHNTAI